jgi:hypothetical protein
MRPQRFASLSVTGATLVLSLLAIAGCNNSSTASLPPPPPPSSGAMFITDFTNNTVTVYGQSANCNCNPARQISGSNTGISTPIGIAVDNSGTMYVANRGNQNVLEFPTNGKGNISPTFKIAGFSAPSGIAVDGARNVYVTDKIQASVSIFPTGSNVAKYTISGVATGLSGPDFVTLDSLGDIWVANQTGNSVVEYPPIASLAVGNNNIPPTVTIAGTNTAISSPQGIAFSPGGQLFVAINNPNFNSFDAVLVFSGWGLGANNIAPTNAICGGATGVNNPTGVAINAQGTVFVVNSATQVATGYITTFANNNIGNLSCTGNLPNATVSGPAMLNPAGIALH